MSPFSDSEFLSQLGSLSIQHLLSRDFSAFLKQSESWGIGAIWQLSENASCESLIIYCSAKTGSQGGTEISALITPQFCRQLRSRLQVETGALTELALELPDCIRARIQLEMGAKTDLCQSCRTYGAGFSLGLAGVQWLILWHPQALSIQESQLFLQQFDIFKYHLAYKKIQNSQAPQVESLKAVLHQTEHQFKTQLELLQLHTDLINQQLQPSLSQPYPELQVSTKQLQTTINSMRDALKRLADQGRFPQPADSCELSQLFQLVIQELQPIWRQKQLSIHCQDTSCKMKLDAWQMMQVFQNILHNAIAFSPTRGKISCRWQPFQSEVLIQISDQGPGVREEDVNQIFSPFYSYRPGGSGIGLALAKRVVLEHRGRIWADNLSTGGAQISIVLPIVSIN